MKLHESLTHGKRQDQKYGKIIKQKSINCHKMVAGTTENSLKIRISVMAGFWNVENQFYLDQNKLISVNKASSINFQSIKYANRRVCVCVRFYQISRDNHKSKQNIKTY